jgi:hypothetical protein
MFSDQAGDAAGPAAFTWRRCSSADPSTPGHYLSLCEVGFADQVAGLIAFRYPSFNLLSFRHTDQKLVGAKAND